MKYYVDWEDAETGKIKYDYASTKAKACGMARAKSRQHGSACVVSYTWNNPDDIRNHEMTTHGHIAYFDGVRSAIEGEV